jgi:hypothetical protein
MPWSGWSLFKATGTVAPPAVTTPAATATEAAVSAYY